MVEGDYMLLREELISNKTDDLNKIIENSYLSFYDNMINREKRPMLLGRTIYIDERKLYDGKENGFWHCSSMGDDDTKFDQYPCENDKCKKYCTYKCEISDKNNFLRDENRVPCIYRADKSVWINKLICMVNEKNLNNIKIWKVKNNKKKTTDLKIWYDDDDVSYILIFQIKYNKHKSDVEKYIFKTAYPVVLKPYIRRFAKEYNESKVIIK